VADDAKHKSSIELRHVLDERARQLQEIRTVRASLIRKEKELQDAKRQLSLTVEQRV
jgi:hypothetical protein